MQVSPAICDYARSLTQDCDIDSTCVFLADKTSTSTRLYYLGNFGVSDEILDRYEQHGICDSDPFTDVSLLENNVAGQAGSFLTAEHPVLSRCGSRTDDYWRFVTSEDIEVVGAASMRLQPRLYLTIGAHRDPRRKGRSSVPLEQLGFRIEVLQNKIASSLLSSLLAGGHGYKALIGVVDPASAEAQPRISELSARETEVARLVCQGKQNKEIAWLARMSECTVENHLRRIYNKLGIHNRATLVAQMNMALA